MCRLSFVPGSAKVSKKRLLALFNALEKSCGGDGNGFAAIAPDHSESLHTRGLKLDNKTIVDAIHPLIRQGWSAYYHTRLVSVGWHDDLQCHPFAIEGRRHRGYLCHNGTWREGRTLAEYLGCGSDTAAMAKCVAKFGVDGAIDRDLFPTSGVVLISDQVAKTHRAYYQSGDLEYCPATGIWASAFDPDWPSWGETYRVGKATHDLTKRPERPKPTTKIVTQPSCTFESYPRGWSQSEYTFAQRTRSDANTSSADAGTYVDRNLLGD